MRKLLLAPTVLLSIMLHGQTATDANLGSALSVDSSTTPATYTFAWWGKSGAHYLVEASTDLVSPWAFLPNYNPLGSDAVLGIQLTSDAPRVFFRAIQFTPNDTSALADTDGDGLPDKWELYYFGDLTRDASDAPDLDGLDNLTEFVLGTNPTVTNAGVSSSSLGMVVHTPLE